MTQNKKSKRSKSHAWFIAVRGSYLPNSWQAWLTYLPFVGYLLFAAIIGWRDTTTTATAVLYIVPNWIAASVVMTWIARTKS